ncbi:hypothetical protein TJA_13140 [Thermus sp. LT1-2-5]|uniref:hypothetical protein n=1 Tax=Thermus sp. LT1-2-5 TaxID=3026935 RepID=UPI0030E78A8E
MPWVLEALFLVLALALLLFLLRTRPEGLDWGRAKLKDLLDWSEVESALNALSQREARLKEALQAPHRLLKTQKELSRALAQVREERKKAPFSPGELGGGTGPFRRPTGGPRAKGPAPGPKGSVGQPTAGSGVNSLP